MCFRLSRTLDHTQSRLYLAGLILIGLIFSLSTTGFAADLIYQKVRVPYPIEGEMDLMFFHPDIELMEDDDGALILLTTPELTDGLRERGFKVEVLIDDLQSFYSLRSKDTRDYGVWHTYDEMVSEMQAIHTEFPDISTTPAAIGTTFEGRSIWAMKVSDNPTVDEDEPEVLFDGVHHAREVMAMEIPLHFIRYLCENYGTDPVITFIVDNREVWFVPIVNPDGYVYNELISPNGGGMWRKNRRDNAGSSCVGVDPNRNYPYMWGDASTDPCSETYQGPSPGSEPCVQTMMSFVNSREIVVWQSYHSVVGCVLIPWGYTSAHTDDDAILRAMGNEMTRYNGYDVGQPSEILSITASGNTFDWGYGATDEHRPLYAFTTEVGGSDFWPQQSEREGLIEENLYSDIYLCLAAGGYAELVDLSVVDAGGDTELDAGEVATLSVTVRNPGVEVAVSGVEVTLTCDDPYINLTDAEVFVGDLLPLEEATSTTDLFELMIEPACPAGRLINFQIEMLADGGIWSEKSYSLTVGQLPVIYECDFETDSGGWYEDPSHSASQGDFSRLDPIGTQFQPEDDTTPDPGIYALITAQNPGGEIGVNDVDGGTSAHRSGAIDLSAATHVVLDLNYFFGQRDPGDDSGDLFSLDISSDGGASFPVNLVQVGDINHTANWRHLRVNLEEIVSLTDGIVLRIQASDGPSTGDIIEAGLDDIYFFDRGVGNEMPTAPVLVSPADGTGGLSAAPTLVVGNAIDPDGDPLTYGFRVYADANLTDLVAWSDGVAEGSGGQTTWTVSPPLGGEQVYYWRAFAADPTERGRYMESAAFTVDDMTGVDDAFELPMADLRVAQNPARGEVVIRYYTPEEPTSRLEIFDLSGRRVRTIPGARWAQGWQETSWDGRDDAGEPIGDGLYWIRLVLPTESRVIKVMHVK